MAETEIKTSNSLSAEGNRLESLNTTKSLDERAAKSRQFLATNKLDINKIATDLSIPKINNPADSRDLVGLVIKIQARLGFNQADSGNGQDGVFGNKTLDAYRRHIEKSDQQQAELARNAERLKGGFSPAELASKEQDQIELLRLEQELANAEAEFNKPETPTAAPQAPSAAPAPVLATPTSAPQPSSTTEQYSITPPLLPQSPNSPADIATPTVTPPLLANTPAGSTETVQESEIVPLKEQLTKASEVCFIGDSNANRIAGQLPGAIMIGAEGKNSDVILAMLKEKQEQLRGVKLVLLRVGGNDDEHKDGSPFTPEETLNNIEKIINICKAMGVRDVRILTRQPHKTAGNGPRRTRAKAQRGLTLNKYKNEETDGTRIAVIDLYKYFAGNKPVDDNTVLPKEYRGNDGLHMNAKGYRKALQIISAAIGEPDMQKLPAKT